MSLASLTWALTLAITTAIAARRATTTILTWVPRSALSSEWFIDLSPIDPRTAAGPGSIEPESPRAVRGHESPRRRGSRLRGGHNGSGRTRTRARDGRLTVRSHRQDHHFGADVYAPIEVGHVLVEHADAAARHLMADGGRRVGAVDAVNGIAEVHGAGPQRVTRAAGHKARQVRLALQHFRRRDPVRPFLLAGNGLHA